MASLTHFLKAKLRLKVNRGKSAVDRPWKRMFLGSAVTNQRAPRLKPAPKSVQRAKARGNPPSYPRRRSGNRRFYPVADCLRRPGDDSLAGTYQTGACVQRDRLWARLVSHVSRGSGGHRDQGQACKGHANRQQLIQGSPRRIQHLAVYRGQRGEIPAQGVLLLQRRWPACGSPL